MFQLNAKEEMSYIKISQLSIILKSILTKGNLSNLLEFKVSIQISYT